MKIKDCTGIKGVHFKQKAEEKTAMPYKIHLVKSRSFYEDLTQPGRWWNGSNKLQEFDPKTLKPIAKANLEVVESSDSEVPDFFEGITREQRKQQLEQFNFNELRQNFEVPFERGLKKAVLIEQLLDREGLV